MKYTRLLLAFVIAFAACSSSKESTGVWVNTEKMKGKSYNSIFIVVMTADVQARAKLETDLAAAAESKGYKAVKSIDVMPPSLQDPATPTKEAIVSKVKASGCDAVFVASLLKQEEDVHYTPGQTSYSVMPYYSTYGTYYGFYSHYYPPVVSTPSYFSKEKTYFMQSNLYDAASEEIMWSAQSKVLTPSSLDNFSTSYTTSLIKQLQKAKLLKKK
ncbi:MAG: hypothetical protein ABUT20_65835 [Bacteroidota bacterium]